MDINVTNPTRGQRLETALAMKSESNGFSSMEIMVGRRVSSNEQQLVQLLLLQQMFSRDPREFYDGFAHRYWPEKQTSP